MLRIYAILKTTLIFKFEPNVAGALLFFVKYAKSL